MINFIQLFESWKKWSVSHRSRKSYQRFWLSWTEWSVCCFQSVSLQLYFPVKQRCWQLQVSTFICVNASEFHDTTANNCDSISNCKLMDVIMVWSSPMSFIVNGKVTNMLFNKWLTSSRCLSCERSGVYRIVLGSHINGSDCRGRSGACTVSSRSLFYCTLLLLCNDADSYKLVHLCV